jgi:pimeloyl-ACP methyl ester carboxylesterase
MMNEVTFARRTIEMDGRTLRYAEGGGGDAVVCIDGMLGLRPSRAHGLMAEGKRVIVFDFPDGAADQPLALARAIGAALERMGIERCDLVGHGAGSALALWLALERPQLAGALVLLAPTALGPRRAAEGDLKSMLYAHPERQPDLPSTHARVPPLGDGDAVLEGRVRELKLPVLALFGTEDRLAPPESADRYRAAMADCNLAFVYDAAHAIDIERPEAVAQWTLDFLERRDLFLVSRESGLTLP